MMRVRAILARLRWTCGRHIVRFDLPSQIALLMGCLLIAFHVFALLPQQRRLAMAEKADAGLRTAPARAVERVARNEDAEALSLERFYGFFQNAERQPDVIARLVVMAGDLGLVYRRIDYRPLPESSLGLQGFQIQMPLAGTYPDVRNFVSTVLTRMPTMTLDQIEIARRKDGKEGVEAQVSLSYHYAEGR